MPTSAQLNLAGSSSVYSAGEVPLWFDLAREFTERWVHYRQIREAAQQAKHDQQEDEYLPLVLRHLSGVFPTSTKLQHQPTPRSPWRFRASARGS